MKQTRLSMSRYGFIVLAMTTLALLGVAMYSHGHSFAGAAGQVATMPQTTAQKWLLSSVFLGVIWLAVGCIVPPIQPTGATTRPIKGAAGLGDKLFPNAGNGGYDVQQYDLDLTVDMKSNTITSTATLTAVAMATLDTFNLDFYALTIDALTVNGVATPYQRQEDELVIDPADPLPAGRVFSVTVNYHSQPKPINSSGWLNYFDRVAVGNEALGAATWYPVNNHPVDKATYRYRVKVPPPMQCSKRQRIGKGAKMRRPNCTVCSFSDPYGQTITNRQGIE